MAEEQIQTRTANGTNQEKAVIQTFHTLDIETICPEFIGAKRTKAVEIRGIISGATTDILKKIKARKMLQRRQVAGIMGGLG